MEKLIQTQDMSYVAICLLCAQHQDTLRILFHQQFALVMALDRDNWGPMDSVGLGSSKPHRHDYLDKAEPPVDALPVCAHHPPLTSLWFTCIQK